MSDDAQPDEPAKPKIIFEKAVSGRSTCRATGEKIEKGELRVGLEAYLGGRISVTWQKAVPFLEGCRLEHAPTGMGKCKATGHQFKKGEARFMAIAGKDKKTFFSLQAAADLIVPIIVAVDAKAFDTTKFQGLDAYTAEERTAFYAAFKVPKKAANAFDKAHPPPDPAAASPPPAKKRRVSKKAAAAAAEAKEEADDKDEADDEAEAGADADANGEEDDGAEEGAEEGAGEAEAEDDDDTPENEYERQRREQIARNRARMAELKLTGMAAELAPPSKPRAAFKPRGLTNRKRTQADVPRRASLRQRGVSADGSMVGEERRNGELVIINGERIRLAPGQAIEDLPPRERHPAGPVPFKSADGGRLNDEAFLRLLAYNSAPRELKGKKEQPGGVALADLPLVANDVVKLTRDGVVHMAFHPRCDTLVLAAADKGGHVGLWHIDRDSCGDAAWAPEAAATAPVKPSPGRRRSAGKAESAVDVKAEPAEEEDMPGDGDEEEEEDYGDGTILEFTPHYSYICGLRWAGGAGSAAKLFTCSYDGSVRALDPAAGAFQLVHTDEDAEYSAFDCAADGNTCFCGDKDGDLRVLDLRVKDGQAGPAVNLHDKKVNTVHLEPAAERELASSCSDGTVALWDVRKLTAGGGGAVQPIATAGHPFTCQAAYFAPNGSKAVLTTSRDNTLRIWDGAKGLAERVVIKHNNNTGRWISPLRAVWSPAGDAVICGNMGRMVDVFDDKGEQLTQLSHELMTAIPPRVTVHPFLPVLAAGTGSGRMHIYRHPA